MNKRHIGFCICIFATALSCAITAYAHLALMRSASERVAEKVALMDQFAGVASSYHHAVSIYGPHSDAANRAAEIAIQEFENASDVKTAVAYAMIARIAVNSGVRDPAIIMSDGFRNLSNLEVQMFLSGTKDIWDNTDNERVGDVLGDIRTPAATSSFDPELIAEFRRCIAYLQNRMLGKTVNRYLDHVLDRKDCPLAVS